jgi:hypothetical protein
MEKFLNKDNLSVQEYVEKYKLHQLIQYDNIETEKKINESVDVDNLESYPPNWEDLVRLHKLVIERKVTTILEFGSGYSTVILAHALNINKKIHANYVLNNLRRNNAYELHSLETYEKFIDTTSSYIPKNLKKIVNLYHEKVYMSEFQSRICTLYNRLPNISPDFIYLDGPDIYNVQGDVRGISTRHPDTLPMSADILAIEHFLLPGTMILVDGRTANARFLASNFQRNWSYSHDVENDVHYFEMMEQPLGKYNKKQIEFCLGLDWYKNFN